MVITRFYDVFTTYLYIPDLKGETNPMVSVFNFGWAGSLITQILVLGLVTYTTYIYYFKPIETMEVEEKTTLTTFISIFHFNTKNDFLKLFYKLPTTKYSLLYSTGAIVSKALIVISFMVGSSTTLLILNERYRTLYREYNIPILLYLIIIIIIMAFTVDFYKRERKERINKMASAERFKI